MSSRLLAQAQHALSTDSAASAFEILPEIPDSLCFHPRGILDGDRVGLINDEVISALKENSKYLFFDFSRIDDLTAAGLGFLVALQKRMRGRGGDLVLYGMRPKLQHFLETLGFKSFFSSALDLRYAVEYIVGMKRDTFPISTVCPACSSPLGIDEPGRGRCRACNAVLTVLPDGSVELG